MRCERIAEGKPSWHALKLTIAGVIVCGSFGTPSVALGVSSKESAAALVGLLRDASECLRNERTNRTATARPLPGCSTNPAALLAYIGLAQVGLRDVLGGVATASALPSERNCLGCGPAYRDFVYELCAALIRQRQSGQAVEVMTRCFADREISLADCRAVVSLLAASGDRDAGRYFCESFMRRHAVVRSFDDTIDLAYLKAVSGDFKGAIESRQQCERWHAEGTATSERCAALVSLALLCRTLSDQQGVERCLTAARTIAHDEHSWHCIAIVYADSGNIDAALDMCAKVDMRRREWLLLDIALVRMEQLDCAGA